MISEEFALQMLANRVLVALRESGAKVVVPDGEDWRATIRCDFELSLWSGDRNLVETILACDCKCPSECGMTVMRFCTMKDQIAANWRSVE